jgi:outer membrane biosynthesis protein TonB
VRHKSHESTRTDYEIRDDSCSAHAHFWQSVTLIGLAHVALILGLIRWSLAARASPSPESIVWLGNAQALAGGESGSGTPPGLPAEVSTPRPQPDEEERSITTTAKSEIELPSPTPKPTATATPSPKPTATATPKPISKPTPKKTLVAKAAPKPSLKAKASSAKASEKSQKNESASQSGSGKTASAVKSGSPGGGSGASEFGWYGNMLHDRFYSAWIQPTANVTTGTKISTLVKVRIEKDGRVSKFEIIKPSENIVVNESVAAVAKQVTEVDPPPNGLIHGDHYDVKINFELSTDPGTETR